MPIRVKIASNPLELDGLFKTRHKVFVEEEGYIKAESNGRIFDQYDAFPSTANLVAMVNREVVGGLRLTEWSEGGAPSDTFFDFRSVIPEDSAKVATASMLCLNKEFRELTRLCFMMLSMGTYWGISKGINYVVAAINPLVEPMIHAVGFERIHAPIYDKAHGVNFVPMLLDMAKVKQDFLNMAKFQGFHGSLRTFDRELYRKGEIIIEKGTTGDEAYVIVKGEVSISRPGRRSNDPPNQVISRLGSCEIFGELALLTEKPQTTEAAALTDVDLMVIDREIFWEQLNGNPDLQLKLLRLLGNRLVDTVENIPSESLQMASNWM